EPRNVAFARKTVKVDVDADADGAVVVRREDTLRRRIVSAGRLKAREACSTRCRQPLVGGSNVFEHRRHERIVRCHGRNGLFESRKVGAGTELYSASRAADARARSARYAACAEYRPWRSSPLRSIARRIAALTDAKSCSRITISRDWPPPTSTEFICSSLNQLYD